MACFGLLTHSWASAKPSISDPLCYVFDMCIEHKDRQKKKNTLQSEVSVPALTSKEAQFESQACV